MKKNEYQIIETLGDKNSKHKLVHKYQLQLLEEGYVPCDLGDFILHLNNCLDNFMDDGFEDLGVEISGLYYENRLAIVGYKTEDNKAHKKRLAIIGKKEEQAKEKRRIAYEELKKEFS